MAQESYTWKSEHENVLEKVGATNLVESDWDEMRGMIKYKIEENVAQYLSDAKSRKDDPPPKADSEPSSSSTAAIGPPTPPVHSLLKGLVVPPFPPRNTSKQLPKDLDPAEARTRTDYIIQLLDNFDDYPPFTIQRVCELAIKPREHYSSLGKYLRAIERSLFVTSTWDQYILDTYALDSAGPATVSMTAIETLKHATTPIFSPIPFLRNSASPPPSPLLLSGDTDEKKSPLPTTRPLKVDELDDAGGKGHMADHPESFSATTTLPATAESRSGAPSPPNVPPTLSERFVRSSSPEPSPARAVEGAEWAVEQAGKDKGKGKATEERSDAIEEDT